MNFSIKAAALTDIGAKRRVNQDAIMIKVLNSKKLGRICFALVCDGLGGLSRGEVASRAFSQRMEKWFYRDLVDAADRAARSGTDAGRLISRSRLEWLDIVQEMNGRIAGYGNGEGIRLGTTAVAFLLAGHRYLIMHVGDSRLYMSHGGRFKQMTRDHSLIQRQLDEGAITPEEALVSDRKSVLLQCIGASETVEPDFSEGVVFQDTSVMLCSDGFWRRLDDKVISESMDPVRNRGEAQMNKALNGLVADIRKRGESDNISVILLSLTAEAPAGIPASALSGQVALC